MIDLTEKQVFLKDPLYALLTKGHEEDNPIPWIEDGVMSSDYIGSEAYYRDIEREEEVLCIGNKPPKKDSNKNFYLNTKLDGLSWRVVTDLSNNSSMSMDWIDVRDSGNIYTIRTTFTEPSGNLYTFDVNTHLKTSQTSIAISNNTSTVVKDISWSYKPKADSDDEFEDIWGLPVKEHDVFSDPNPFYQKNGKLPIFPVGWNCDEIKSDSFCYVYDVIPWFRRTLKTPSFRQYGRRLTQRENQISYEEELELYFKLRSDPRYDEDLLFDRMHSLSYSNPSYMKWDNYVGLSIFYYNEEDYQKEELPWVLLDSEETIAPSIPEPQLHLGTDGEYTKWITWCIPWMVDMIRDVWRHVVSPKLVEEYFSSHWYTYDNPVYREKWFHNEDGDREEDGARFIEGLNMSITPDGFLI